MDQSEDVDFDFFDTPRNDVSESPTYARSSDKNSKPPRGSLKRVSGEKITGKHTANVQEKLNRNQDKEIHDIYSSDESSDSDSDSETPRIQRAPVKIVQRAPVNRTDGKKPNGIPRGKMLPNSPESSSAYSDSDSDSVDSYENKKGDGDRQRTSISVTLPKTAQAWGAEEKSDRKDHHSREERMDRNSYQSSRKRREPKKEKASDMKTNSESDSDSSREHYKNKETRSGDKRHNPKSKIGREKTEKQSRQPLKSTSSSYSNNSDITDVSPLESPDVSPREARKRYNVQYGDKTASDPVDIRLDSDKIDLSILMKCMSDIDREKQQRLKANSRRVMFAPSSHNDKPNFTYSSSRAKMIEKENQRLLQQIMHHVQPGSRKLKPGSATKPVPKKAVEPVIQRLTPSAVNRQREQRKIEMENMQFLQRLQTVRATRGMSRQDQLNEFERQAAYGMPTCIIPTNTGHFDRTMPYRETQSHMSGTVSVGQTQRSRPSSAKSNLSTASRRSRPSSAKSNASIRSNASMRSNVSIRSGTSTLREQKDRRPAWDDRFSFS